PRRRPLPPAHLLPSVAAAPRDPARSPNPTSAAAAAPPAARQVRPPASGPGQPLRE
ncbi:hypothetical protein P7K49_008748, partial [Saguinus oedipus]